MVFEHQHGPPALAHEPQRSHRPGPIQLVPQSVLVSKTVEGRWRCGLGRNNNQHGAVVTISTGAQSSAEDAFAILPDDLKNFKLIRTEP